MADFIDVPAKDLEDFLQKHSFTRGKQGNEVVYVRRSTVDPNLMLKVYTSIRDGQVVARASGRDSIKVCVVWDDGRGKSFGVGRFPPVFRVTSVASVLERLDLKLKEAVLRAKEWLAEQAAKEDKRQKELFAQREREQEKAAFMSDPDMQDDPKNPRDPKFAAYAASLEVPF